MSEQLGFCDDVSRGQIPHVQDIGCVNWRGMMTAEQFWLTTYKDCDGELIYQHSNENAFKFAESYAAAQLAEFGAQ